MLVSGQVDRCFCNSGFIPNRIDLTACLNLSVVVCTPDHLTCECLLSRWIVVLTLDGPSFNRMLHQLLILVTTVMEVFSQTAV